MKKNNNLSSKILLEDILSEIGGRYEVYAIDKMLWIAVSPGNGLTHEIDTSFFVDKSGEPHSNPYLAKQLLKWAAYNRPVKSTKTKNLYKFPVYSPVNAYRQTQAEYEIWGGEISPIGTNYMIITQESDYHIFTFFKKKNEAMAWMRS